MSPSHTYNYFISLQGGFSYKIDASFDRHESILFKLNNNDCHVNSCKREYDCVHSADLVADNCHPPHGLGGATSGCDHVHLKGDMAQPSYSDTNNPLDLSSEPHSGAYPKQNGTLVTNPNDEGDRAHDDTTDYGEKRHLHGVHMGVTNNCPGVYVFNV